MFDKVFMCFVLRLIFVFAYVFSTIQGSAVERVFVESDFLISMILDCIASEKNIWTNWEYSGKQEKEDISLVYILNLRRVNQSFNHETENYFFPNALCFNNFVAIDNRTLLFQIGNVMKMCASLDISCVPNDFPLVKTWILSPHRSFISRSMSFLDIPNKTDVQELTVKETDSACYLFFQNDKKELLQSTVDQLNTVHEKKRRYAFLPCHSINFQGYSDIPQQTVRILAGFTLNGFPKNSIRIPDDIIDWKGKASYIFFYNDGCQEKIDKKNGVNVVKQRINFISLYIALDWYERRRWNKEQLVQNSCYLFKKFLQKTGKLEMKEKFLKDDVCTRNVIDVHFVNDSLRNLDVLQQMRNSLQACCTDTFLVRAVFDEEYEDLSEYKHTLINRLLTALHLKKSLSQAIVAEDIRYVKDVICYFLKNSKVEKGIKFLRDLIKRIQDEGLIDDENILDILAHVASRITPDHLECFLLYDNTFSSSKTADNRFSQYIIEHLSDELYKNVSTFCCNDKNIWSFKYRFGVPFAWYVCLLNQCVKKNYITDNDYLTLITKFCVINKQRGCKSIYFIRNENTERTAVVRELVRLASPKNIWEIHQEICSIAPRQFGWHLVNGSDPLFFQAKFYFLWYFKHIALGSILTISGPLLLKHRSLISIKIKELRK